MRKKTISAKKYQEKMDAIIAMGKPISDTFIAMVEEAGKYNLSQKTTPICDKITQPALRKKYNKVRWMDFSLMRQELYCEHGVGHGFHVHGCDGCCGDPSFAKEFKRWQKKTDKAGIKSQRRILKCMNFKSKSMQRGKK
jgi:hypothetical protein